MATPAVDDDHDIFSLDARLGVEDVATLVLVFLLLESQNFGDNKSGARIVVAKDLQIFVFIHLAMYGHLLQSLHLVISHRVIGFVIICNHAVPSGVVKCLVATALASETLN